MPYVQIPTVYAADPGDIWTPKSYFVSSEAFAIVMRVQASSDLVKAGLSYEAVFQMVTPRLDIHNDARWWTVAEDQAFVMPTKDIYWDSEPFTSDNFAIAVSWNKYEDAVAEIRGPERTKGLFYVRGTIDVVGTNLFAHSDESWYKVVPGA